MTQVSVCQSQSKLHSVHPQTKVEPLTKFYKKEGLTGPQLLEGVAGKEGVTLIRRGLQFSHKNKLKSEIFNDKKVYKQKYFSL